MTESKQCKMEFYFTRENIEKLLKNNPAAKGIIIRQEIKLRTTSDNKTINVIEIKAIADNAGIENKKTALKASSVTDTDGSVAEIDGCPQPPGCI